MRSIRLEAVSKTYHVNEIPIAALRDINLAIEPGEIFGVIGYSGAGKSTLIRLINRLEEPDEGSIFIDQTNVTRLSNKDLRSFRHKIGMIFQHFNLLSSRTVAENIALPLELVACQSKTDQAKKVSELLDLVGLTDLADHYPRQLSGGQKQRVGIARALANEPDILLCDEATSALDPQTTHDILDLIAKINRQFKLTVVLITHEMDVIRRIADKVAILDKGHIVEVGTVLECFLHPKNPVTASMIGQLQHLDELIESGVLKQAHDHIWRLTFIGQAVKEPFLHDLSKRFDLTFSILQGSIARLKNTPYGQLVVQFKGGEKVLKKAKNDLEKQNIMVDLITLKSLQTKEL